MLYPISSGTGAWALERVAKAHHLDLNAVHEEARKIAPEFLCHAPKEFMEQLAQKMGRNELLPESNPDIMSDWRAATAELNKRFLFRDIAEAMQKIKDQGGMVYIATNAPPANVFHRLHIWFGERAVDLFDAIAMRTSLDGMSARNQFCSNEEEAFIARLYDNNKIIIVPHHEIKPNGKTSAIRFG